MRQILATCVIVPLLATAAIAMDGGPAPRDSSPAFSEDQMAVASAINEEAIRRVQQTLNKRGFDAGHVDGVWGPQTTAAIRNFQMKEHLPASGRLDERTMTALGLSNRSDTTGVGTLKDDGWGN